jgi:hypothetical protein
LITFIDEKGTEHSALVAYSVTNAVNGELSVKGTIYTNDKVLHGIDRGWRFRLDDEYYRVTYAKPNDAGQQIEVEFDAVHQFFYDMSKSMVYDTLNGSKPFETYLQAIFSGSGYTYNLETTVGSIRKENFGNKSRLSLFNDIIKAAGLEFSVRGHVIRILKRIGTDLSAIVRKDFNMNELKIEKNINSFVTYQRGLGAWKDDEDHSKGRYESEYKSPLAKIYGRIEAEPVVDERYKETGKLLERLKENVDKSYKVSVEIDMEDLSRAGYQLSRPSPGDFIMAINETLGFRQKVRIVSFTSEYDIGGNLISRKVVCNDIGSVQRRASEMSSLARSVQDVAAENAKAIATATKALVSADGKNTIYFSESKPRDEPVGTLRKGDQLYLKEGEKTNLYFWNGAEWELNPLEMDIVKFRKEYESKTKEINQSMATQTQQTTQALRTAGANASAIEAAKGAITKLNQDLAGAKQTNQTAIDRLKSDFANAQKTASDQTALLKSDLVNIRTKQSQAESEIAKQVSALNQTKTELMGVKSAQATFEQTTTRRLAELANVADGKASKSELVQTAEELASRIASVHLGRRNLLKLTRTLALNEEKPWITADSHDGFVIARSVAKDKYTDTVKLRTSEPPKGTEYVLIFYARASRDNYPIRTHFYSPNTTLSVETSTGYKRTRSGDGEAKLIIDSEWKRYWVKYTQTATDEIKRVFIGRHGSIIDGGDSTTTVEICAPALFEGNLVGDWSPAYEDQDERVSAVESNFKQRADSLEAGVNRLTEGLKTKADSSALTLLSDSIKQSVKSLETDTQNKLDQKLSTAVFEVRASGIHQEIVNATKDKADKALVTAEAGRLREELASQVVGGRNLMGVFNTTPVKSSFEPDTYRFAAKTTKNTTRPTLQLQFRWTDGTYSAVAWISQEGPFKKSFRITKDYTELRIKFNCNKEDAVLLFKGNKFIEINTDYLFTGNLLNLSPNDSVADFLKIERATIPSDWSPALEDTEGLITEAKAVFERTAQGLQMDLAAVQAYVNADGARSEALRTYSREETARQLTAERKAIEAGYVAKAQHTEDVRSISRRFEELKASSETKLAEYRQTVEGQFATISSQISGKANQTDFQRVQETSKLYERLIGSTEKEVTDNISRMALTNELFQVEVSKNLELRTVQYQIANAWAVQNLNSNGDIVSQINATGPNVRIQGESIHLDGKTLIDNGVIKNAMIESMLADKITAGTLNAAIVNIVNLNANKLVGLDANFIKSKIELALVEWLKGKVITAQNDAMKIDLNNGQYNVMTDQAAIRRVLSGYPNQFLKFTSENEGGAPASVTVLGANRDGTENSKNDSFAGIRLFSGNKVERTEIISDVVRFATGAVNYRGWEMRTLYGNDNRQVILQPFGNVTRSNIVANYFNGIDLTNVLETLNQMMANLANHTGRRDIFGPIPGLGARKYQR